MIVRLAAVLSALARGLFWAVVDAALTRLVFAAMMMRSAAGRRSAAHMVRLRMFSGVHAGSAIKRVQLDHAAVSEVYDRAVRATLAHDAASTRAMFCQMEVERLTHAHGEGRP